MTIAIEHVAIDGLRPDPANPRRISDAELESLTRSLREFGFSSSTSSSGRAPR